MKTCTLCKKEKPLSEYYPVANGIKGVRPRCKECHRSVERKKYGENADFRIRKLEIQYEKFKNNKEFRASHMKAQRRWHLMKMYGITLDQFDLMLADQGGGCAICGTKAQSGEPKTRMVVDHCHSTGKNRGILCDLCNTALGKFKDNVEILHSAINYLKNSLK